MSTASKRWLAVALAALAACGGSSQDTRSDGGGDAGGDGGTLPMCSGTPLTTSGVLDIDLAAVHVTGHITLDGGALPGDPSGALVFTETKTRVTLSIAVQPSYDVVLAPGVYAISFAGSGTSCAGPMPCNSGVIKDGIALATDGVLDLDIPAITVTGNLTSNGAPLASGSEGALKFALANGDPAELDVSPMYSVTLLPGSYAIGFAGQPGCAGPLPCNTGPLKTGVMLATSGVLDLDIPAVAVTGKITRNHAALPAEVSGVVTFAIGHGASAAAQIAPTYATTLLPGTYTVGYGSDGACSGTGMPCNSGPLQTNVAITTSGVLDLDIPVEVVTGKITVNGAALPAQAFGELAFSLGDGNPAIVELAATYSVTLLAGTYAVALAPNSATSCSGPVPCTPGPLKSGVAISTNGALDVDIPAVHVTGAVTLDGGPVAATGGAALGFALTTGQPGEVTLAASYAVTVLPGAYTVTYQDNGSCNGSLPCNSGPIKTGVALTTDGVLDLDIPSVAITGKVTLAGAQLPEAATDRGQLGFALDGGDTASTASLGAIGAANYATTILPGRYIILYEGNRQLCDPTALPSPPCMDELVKGCP